MIVLKRNPKVLFFFCQTEVLTDTSGYIRGIRDHWEVHLWSDDRHVKVNELEGEILRLRTTSEAACGCNVTSVIPSPISNTLPDPSGHCSCSLTSSNLKKRWPTDADIVHKTLNRKNDPWLWNSPLYLHLYLMEFSMEAEASAAGKMAAEAKHEKVPLIVHGVCMHGCFLNIYI